MSCKHLINARCTHASCRWHGKSVSVGTCNACDLYDGPGRQPLPAPVVVHGGNAQTPPADCRHRGKQLDLIDAPVCGGKAPIHECTIHGKAIITCPRGKDWQPPDGVRVCADCDDRQSRL